MEGGAPVSGGDGDGWIQYRIFFANPAETTPRGKELEALSWIPTLDREASELLGSHHWHREGFRLRLVMNEKALAVHAKNEPHLVGRTEFGESLDDEWLIVWLLFELSKRHPELLISVMDNDGQFLLIEAALVLPRWLKPENSDHRVWIRGGRLHIIPRPSAAHPSLPTKLDLLGALAVLRSCVPTRADELIERTIRDRLSGMPNAELNLLHHATVLVPTSAARLLHADGSLVAAVAAFYTRDVDGMKVASRMARFDPRRTPLVPMRLCFTRLQYAQVDRQPFPPPPAFTLPPRASAEFRAAEVGMKLTVGLEILAALAKPDPLDELAPLPVPALPVAAADAEWADFLRLVRAHSTGGGGGGGGGRGGGGPSDEDVAQAFLRTTRSSLYRDAAKKSWHYKLKCAEAAPCDEASLKAATLAPRVPDDPLDWMNVTAEMVEDILARTEREMQAAEAEGGPSRPPPSAEAMAEQVKRFVEAKSGLEGVEPARGTAAAASSTPSHSAPVSGAQTRSPAPAPASATPSAPEGDVSFDPAKFLQALRSTLDYEGVDDEEDAEGDEDGELDGSSADGSEGDEDGADDLAGDSEEEAELRAYMDEMERQLRGTAMADTFEREPTAPKPAKAASAQTAQTATGAAATTGAEAKAAAAPKATVAEDDDDDELPPVDLDLNLVKNLLDSIAGQNGLPGPASALLASLSQAKSKKP